MMWTPLRGSICSHFRLLRYFTFSPLGVIKSPNLNWIYTRERNKGSSKVEADESTKSALKDCSLHMTLKTEESASWVWLLWFHFTSSLCFRLTWNASSVSLCVSISSCRISSRTGAPFFFRAEFLLQRCLDVSCIVCDLSWKQNSLEHMNCFFFFFYSVQIPGSCFIC